MRGHRRNYYPGMYEHIFQHALGYRVVFFSMEDRLVFYTIFSVYAQRYGIVVLALALMYNHFHTIINASSSKVRALFIGTFTSTFSKAFNKDIGRKGALFEKAYGNAAKRSDKKVRTSIAYSYNNSVEKSLFGRAEEDRWNYLAYIGKDSPFSDPIVLNMASQRLRAALKEVDDHVKGGQYLSYATVRRLFKGLSIKEKEQLLDYIISRYLPIDRNALLGFYKGYHDMLIAINSNTGNEYEIKEEYNPDSDQVYTQMLDAISQSSFAAKPHSIVMASPETKRKIADILKRITGAKDYQIARVLHLDAW